MRKLITVLAVVLAVSLMLAGSAFSVTYQPPDPSWATTAFGTDCDTYSKSEQPHISGLLIWDPTGGMTGNQWKICPGLGQYWGAWWDVTCDVEQFSIQNWGASGTRLYFHLASPGAAPAPMTVNVPGNITTNMPTLNYWIGFSSDPTKLPKVEEIDGSAVVTSTHIPLSWGMKVGGVLNPISPPSYGAKSVSFAIAISPGSYNLNMLATITPSPYQAAGRYFLDADGYATPGL